MLDEAELPDSIGRLAHYEVIEVIGAGSTGVVFWGGEHVAISGNYVSD